MLTHVHTISVQVNDADEALAFYTGILGMDKVQDVAMDDQGNRWIEVAPPGAQTRLVLSTGPGPEGWKEPGGFTCFIFEADDVKATCAELENSGVNITVPFSVEPWGRWAQFTDPDGNEFGVWGPPE